MTRTTLLTLLATLALLPVRARAEAAAETFSIAPFGLVRVYAPAGPPAQVVLFVSGDGGWNLGVIPMAERLRDEGVAVGACAGESGEARAGGHAA